MVTDSLFAPYVDEKYKDFTSRLSTSDTLPRLGIRVPILRKLAKEIDWREYEIKWHEDVILIGLAIGDSDLSPKDKIQELKKLLPYLSAWDQTDIKKKKKKKKKKNKYKKKK